MSTTNFSFPTAIRFGAGARKQVAEPCWTPAASAR
jgi:hypothetical protein